jgi:hypothetical protein
VQLSNKGGNLVLLDAGGHQVDAVVFTAADTSSENQFHTVPPLRGAGRNRRPERDR